MEHSLCTLPALGRPQVAPPPPQQPAAQFPRSTISDGNVLTARLCSEPDDLGRLSEGLSREGSSGLPCSQKEAAECTEDPLGNSRSDNPKFLGSDPTE